MSAKQINTTSHDLTPKSSSVGPGRGKPQNVFQVGELQTISADKRFVLEIGFTCQKPDCLAPGYASNTETLQR